MGHFRLLLAFVLVFAASMMLAFQSTQGTTNMSYADRVANARKNAAGSTPEDLRPLLTVVLQEDQPGSDFAVAEDVKLRLLRAESAFRSQKTKGVQVSDLARALNAAADELGLPRFAHVTPSQIGELRLGLAKSKPNFAFANHAPSPHNPNGNGMSPIEAVYISTMMLDQKLLNPRFQKTPEVWEAEHQANKQKEKQQTAGAKSFEVRSRKAPPETQELSDKLRLAVGNRDKTSLNDLVQRTLTLAGVEQ